MIDLVTGISIAASVAAAFGAPGVTFWVIKRMTSSFMQSQKEGCARCRSDLDYKISEVAQVEAKIIDRQMALREVELPIIRETYARKADLEKASAEMKVDLEKASAAMKVDLHRSTVEIKTEINGLGAGMKSDMKDMCNRVSDDIKRVQDRVDHFHGRREPNV
jgi:hypothetical protein